MRTGLLRAMNRFSAAHRIATRINSVRPAWHEPLIAPWEIRHSSPATQALYDAYVDCVLACSSTLDLLYKLLIYVSTEPLGSPVSPDALSCRFPVQGDHPPIFPGQLEPRSTTLGRKPRLTRCQTLARARSSGCADGAMNSAIISAQWHSSCPSISERAARQRTAVRFNISNSWLLTLTAPVTLLRIRGCRVFTSKGVTPSISCTPGFRKRPLHRLILLAGLSGDRTIEQPRSRSWYPLFICCWAMF